MTQYNKNFNFKKEGKCNKEEHKQWNRRSFLQALGLVGGGTIAFANSTLSASKSSSPLVNAISQAESDRVLIIVELAGGNDGLNTIVPVYDYDIYANARPGIRIKENNITLLNDDFGIPSYATKLEEMWGDGKMKVVHGVGFDNSTLSHFKGEDIWATANRDPTEIRGWIGRYFEEIYPDYAFEPPLKPAAIKINNGSSLVLNGFNANYGLSVESPEKLYEIAKSGQLYDVKNLPACIHGEQKGFLRGLANATFSYAGVINDAYTSSTDYGDYPNNGLANQLSIISRMIKGNLGTKVYVVRLGGFDTHNGQPNTHENLIKNVSESLSHFYKDLSNAGWDDKVLCMTTSEFGRRVKENGSSGTDHGRASQSMIFGSGLNGSGFVGTHPDLSNLDRSGNLQFTKDFRELYASVLKDWLCVDATIVNEVLLGQEYDNLDLGFECSATPDIDPDVITVNNDTVFKHYVNYNDYIAYLNIEMPTTGHVDIKLYNLLGQEVGTLKNEMLFAGKHSVNINDSLGYKLITGQYIYRIITSDTIYSKSLIIN